MKATQEAFLELLKSLPSVLRSLMKIQSAFMLKYPLKIKIVCSVNQLHLFLSTYRVNYLIFSDVKTVQFKS